MKRSQPHRNSSTQRKPTNDFTYPPTEESKVLSYRKTHSITIQGHTTNFKPIDSFSPKIFPKDLLTLTTSFSKPTPIQSQCWPILLSRHNVVGIAETGSGKTLAYGLPGLLHIKKLPVSELISVKMVVLAPTRELAIQIDEVLREAGKAAGIKVACIFGGVSKTNQEELLRDGVHVIVATPGRLIDFLESGICDLNSVFFLVLDEADRMLDMGFEPEIKKIIQYIPEERQTAMFSATWPEAIQKLSKQYIQSPIHVTIGSSEGKLAANSNVTQIVEVIESDNRDTKLIQLLNEYHKSRKNKILIFVLYKKEASRIEFFLNKRGWHSVSIHSDKNQSSRIEALNAFKSGKTPLLIATDVASRGLDIPLVEYVINYSFPLTIEDYVHRIGRTGRAGNKGISHTFFQHTADKQHAGGLVNVLKETNQPVPESLLQFDLSVKKKEPKLGKIEIEKTQNSHITFDSDDDN